MRRSAEILGDDIDATGDLHAEIRA